MDYSAIRSKIFPLHERELRHGGEKKDKTEEERDNESDIGGKCARRDLGEIGTTISIRCGYLKRGEVNVNNLGTTIKKTPRSAQERLPCCVGK